MVGKNYANKVGSTAETQGAAKTGKITASDFPKGSGQTNTAKRQFGGVKRKNE